MIVHTKKSTCKLECCIPVSVPEKKLIRAAHKNTKRLYTAGFSVRYRKSFRKSLNIQHNDARITTDAAVKLRR